MILCVKIIFQNVTLFAQTWLIDKMILFHHLSHITVEFFLTQSFLSLFFHHFAIFTIFVIIKFFSLLFLIFLDLIYLQLYLSWSNLIWLLIYLLEQILVICYIFFQFLFNFFKNIAVGSLVFICSSCLLLLNHSGIPLLSRCHAILAYLANPHLGAVMRILYILLQVIW